MRKRSLKIMSWYDNINKSFRRNTGSGDSGVGAEVTSSGRLFHIPWPAVQQSSSSKLPVTNREKTCRANVKTTRSNRQPYSRDWWCSTLYSIDQTNRGAVDKDHQRCEPRIWLIRMMDLIYTVSHKKFPPLNSR